MASLLRELFNLETRYVTAAKAELIGVGSILDSYHRKMRKRESVPLHKRRPWRQLHVWGSGFMDSTGEPLWPQSVNYHAVRGKLTRSRIGTEDIAIGDPGLLLPRIWPAKGPKKHAVAIIPHFATLRTFLDDYQAILPDHWKVINLLGEPEAISNEIASSEFVVSSSLHGLIVADAYGIPSSWMMPHGRIKGDGFKFDDYASQRGKPLASPVDFQDFLKSPLAYLQDSAYAPCVPDELVLNSLLKSFPFK